MAGNVDTRLRRLEEGDADALILASAGLDRLGRAHVIARRLEPDEMLGAPAQGALGIGCRADDARDASGARDDGRRRVHATARSGARSSPFPERRMPRPVGARFCDGRRGEPRSPRGRVLSLDGRECLEDEVSEPVRPVPLSPEEICRSAGASRSASSRRRHAPHRRLARGGALTRRGCAGSSSSARAGPTSRRKLPGPTSPS